MVSEEYQALRKDVGKVLGMIVKRWACVDKSPSSKRVRIEGYHTNITGYNPIICIYFLLGCDFMSNLSFDRLIMTTL